MTGRDVANYDEAYAKAAEEYSKQNRGTSRKFFGTRGGILALDGDAMPGNQIAAVIADSYLENAYFEGDFDPDVIKPPVCYAFGRVEPTEMVPHIPSMAQAQDYFRPQHIENGQIMGCRGCPKNEWKSAPKGGGKACKNQVKLTLLPAGIYSQQPRSRDWELKTCDSPDHFTITDEYGLSVPVTSTTAYEKYKDMLRTRYARPPFGAITRIFLAQHPKYQFTVNFELIDLLPNEHAAAVLARNEIIAERPFVGYQKPEARDAPERSGISRFGRR